MFADPLSLTFPNPRHSIGEERLVIIGQSANGRIFFVSHPERDTLIKIISAREVIRREQLIYEEFL